MPEGVDGMPATSGSAPADGAPTTEGDGARFTLMVFRRVGLASSSVAPGISSRRAVLDLASSSVPSAGAPTTLTVDASLGRFNLMVSGAPVEADSLVSEFNADSSEMREVFRFSAEAMAAAEGADAGPGSALGGLIRMVLGALAPVGVDECMALAISSGIFDVSRLEVRAGAAGA